MGQRPNAPLYLARESYRLRRLIDAQRLVPIALFILYLLPLVWGGEGTGEPRGFGARSYVHVFAIWGGAIAVVALITRSLMRAGASLDVAGGIIGDALLGEQVSSGAHPYPQAPPHKHTHTHAHTHTDTSPNTSSDLSAKAQSLTQTDKVL